MVGNELVEGDRGSELDGYSEPDGAREKLSNATDAQLSEAGK